MKVRHTRPTLLVLVAPLLLSFIVAACSRPQVTPTLLTLERDGVTMYLLGTIHKIPEEQIETLLRSGGAIVDRIERSHALFLELGEDWVTWDDRLREIVVAGPGRPSVEALLAEWEPPRRESFLENMSSFPMMDHVGRQEQALTMRPINAVRKMEEIVDRIGKIDARPSVEGLLVAEAWDRGIPLLGLETHNTRAEIFDSLDDEMFLVQLEQLFALEATEQEMGEAVASDLSATYETWAAGTLDWPEGSQLGSLLETEVTAGANETRTAEFDAAYHRAIYYERERRWVPVIDAYLQQNSDVSTIFVGVGAAHITPDRGYFVGLLEEAGWQITEVEPESFDRSRYEQAARAPQE